MLCESRDERIVVCGQWGKKLARPYFKKQVVNWRCGSSESACPVALSLIATTTIKKKQSKKKKSKTKQKPSWARWSTPVVSTMQEDRSLKQALGKSMRFYLKNNLKPKGLGVWLKQ
jgi:L-lactate utilization protein LutB